MCMLLRSQYIFCRMCSLSSVLVFLFKSDNLIKFQRVNVQVFINLLDDITHDLEILLFLTTTSRLSRDFWQLNIAL
ncbi:hypothetical protein TSAR_001378 [Trichomalopsis sarcophagae]|uniref:Uncharacterized protein n=1 Tax=Trichomalopsis sarcophagae TaxID=543379 RepID=A0A232ETJ0_9HYME|nr:hypothetical protein TSAR_001378 [Trichomalopsis sarcophagae]